MALAETAHLVTQLDLKDGLSSGLARAKGAVAGFDRSVNQSMQRVGKGVGQVGAGLARVGIIAGTATVAGLAGAAKAAIDFEDAFAGVRKTVDEADLQRAGLSFDKLARSFRDMATEIPISAVEFARIGETAGALGIRAKDIQEFTRVVALMGVTTNLSSDEAADAFGRIGTILKLRGKDYTELADSIVALGNAGASTESEITEITKRFAAEAKAAGLNKEAIVGLASATASLGFAPERGGTALSRVFANLATNIATANSKGKALAQELGVPIKDLQRTMDQGEGMRTFFNVLEAIKGMRPTEAARFLKSIGVTNTSDRTIFRAMAEQLPFVREQLEIATEATGAMGKEAEKRFSTVKSQFALLKNNIVEAGITIGEGFAPALGRAAKRLSAWIKANKDDLVDMGREIGRAIDGIDWGRVMGALKTVVGLFRQGWEIVRQIPPEVAAIGAGLFGLNKLSGGLLGHGIGNIVGGLGSALTKGVMSKVPGVGSFVAQPVFVTNWPMGGVGAGGAAGGVAGKGMGLLGKAAIGVSIIGIAAGVLEAWNTAVIETVNRNQQENAEKAAGIVGEGLAKATTDLSNMSRLLRESQGIERVILDTTSAGEIGNALKNAAEEVFRGANSPAEIGKGIASLVEAQQQAREHGWTEVADFIGTRIEALRRKTPTASQIGREVGKATDDRDREGPSKRDRQNAIRIGEVIKHLRQVKDDGKGRDYGFDRAAQRSSRALIRALSTTGRDRDKVIRATIRDLEREQKRAEAAGATKLARNLGRDITTLQRTLGRKQDTANTRLNTIARKDTSVSVTVPVTTSVSVRDVQQKTTTYSRYGYSAV